jgi:cellulose synthase/poly-beta-1,6-N-acetylglucosamine synthase-like glycosyltransferase
MAYSTFLVSATVVLYTWIAYPSLLRLLRLFRRHTIRPSGQNYSPFVTIIVPVHNEQQKIAVKLGDCLELLYPQDRLEIIVASDASTDGTEEIVRRFVARDSRIQWLQSGNRVGKSGVQNLAAARAQGDILFFTDANTAMTPGVLRTMVDDLYDPEVGLVTATVHFGHPQDAVEKGQGFYWNYELFLRAAESDLGILATGSGQALAVRRELFRPLPACYGDDCIMPLDVRLQGYRVIQDRNATVFDAMPHSIQGELRTRIRMTARNWTGTLARPEILNPLRFPLTALGLISHKLLTRSHSLVATSRLLRLGLRRLGANPKAATCVGIRISIFILPGKHRLFSGNGESVSQSKNRCLLISPTLPLLTLHS